MVEPSDRTVVYYIAIYCICPTCRWNWISSLHRSTQSFYLCIGLPHVVNMHLTVPSHYRVHSPLEKDSCTLLYCIRTTVVYSVKYVWTDVYNIPMLALLSSKSMLWRRGHKQKCPPRMCNKLPYRRKYWRGFKFVCLAILGNTPNLTPHQYFQLHAQSTCGVHSLV